MRKTFTIILLSVIFLQTKAQIIITGVMADPRGSDAIVSGGTMGTGGALTSAGGSEYVQLRATEDIDFTTDPYSVVWCKNAGSVTASLQNGWAAGKDRTFKFNLTVGSVVAGEFFYVGGPQKVMAGYNGTVFSAAIPDAKWKRVIAYANTSTGADADLTNNVVVGDGFGTSSTGLMPNSGFPSGFAVFVGTTVTKDSNPIDAIFVAEMNPISGTAITAAYDGTNGWGYRLPTNDRYTSSVAEPFFGQNTANSFAFLYQAKVSPALTADRGNFLKLAGDYNTTTKVWDSPRTTNYATLFDGTTSTATLTDIEAGGATTLPIKLSSFNAKKDNSNVVLNWVTASENNNDYFIVLRSTDGKKFSEISKVNGAGTVNKVSSYQFVDRKPEIGVNYYRLVQVDVDGISSESKVVYATIGFSDAVLAVSANGGVIVNLNTPVAGKGSIVLSDVQGRKIKSLNKQFTAGLNQINLDSKLVSGLYIVTVQMDNQKLASKFVVK